MSIVMVSSKTKEEILASIGKMLLEEASTPEVQAEIKAKAQAKVAELQATTDAQLAKFDRLKADRKTAVLADDDDSVDKISVQIQEIQSWVSKFPVPSVDEVMHFETGKLVSEQMKLAAYEKWATLFGLESKKAVGRPASGGDKSEARFDGKWGREMTNGVLAVNFRLLTDEQKTRYGLGNASQWVVKAGNATQVVVADYPNNLVVASKMLLGQSVGQVNNAIWNDGKELTAAQVASF